MEWNPFRAYRFVFHRAKIMAYHHNDDIANRGKIILDQLLDPRIPWVRKMEIIYLFIDEFDYFIKKDLFQTKEEFILFVKGAFVLDDLEAKQWAREAMLSVFM